MWKCPFKVRKQLNELADLASWPSLWEVFVAASWSSGGFSCNMGVWESPHMAHRV